MDKISIVIPVYNVEKYIKRCIDSLLKQTYKNIEIILVNDGSTDNTMKIIKKNYSKQKKIITIEQKNSGPAIARNTGIDHANGKYIMFVDSDDFVDSTYVENYYTEIKNTNSDIVIGGYKRYIENKVTKKMQLKNGEYSKYLVTAPYCRIIDLKFLNENKIRFLDTNSSEDIYFNLSIYSKTNKIKIIDDIGYYYFFNKNSISNTAHKGFNENIKIFELLNYINNMKIENQEMKEYFIVKYCVWYLLYSGKYVDTQKFIDWYKKIFSWLDVNIKNYKTNKYISIFRPKEEPFNHRFIIWFFMLFHKTNTVKIFTKLYCRRRK